MKEALKKQEPKQRIAFRNKYLAAVLAVAALLICSAVSAQTDSLKYSQINGYGFKYKRHVQDSVSIIPLSTSPHTPYRAGGIRYRASDSTIQIWTGYQWNSIITGVGNGVDTAYAFNDSTIAIETPDQDFFVKLSGANSIRNQFTSAQDAKFWIDSTGRMRYLQVDSFATFAPIAAPTYAEGRMFYDNTNKTYTLMDDIVGTSIQLSYESLVRARNNTGSTINDGQVVYVSGAVGQNPTIALAQANSVNTIDVIGLATHNISNNSIGKVTTYGLVNDINTNAFNDGDKLWLSQSTPGALTNVKPITGISFFVGRCLTSHVTQGKIFVSPQDVLPGATQLTDSSFVVGVDTIVIGGTGQDLQSVTDKGNKTTDTIISEAIRTNRILNDTLNEPDYEIEVFPDLQGMTLNHPDQLTNMFDWVVANRVTNNIKAVLTLGDLTDNNTASEYTRLDTNFDKFDVLDLPYFGLIGNHDYNNILSRNTTNFNTLGMGESRYAAHSWKGNAFHNKTENFYIKFDVGSIKYLVIGVEFIPTDSALEWAGRVLDSFPDRKAIFLTHAYITTFGERSTDTSRYSSNADGLGNDNAGNEMWEKLIRKKKNIFLVMNGHFLDFSQDGGGYTKRFDDIGDNGNIVHQIFVNYQRSGSSPLGPNEGQGYFMRLRISPSNGKIYTSYYSSYLNQFDPAIDSFSLYDPVIEIESTTAIQGKLVVKDETRLDSTVFISHFPKNRFVTTTYNGQLDTSTIYVSDVATLPNNGLSRDADSTKLGQNIAQSGDPAKLKSDREIPLNGFDLRLTKIGRGNVGLFRLYKDSTKSIAIPYMELRDQRDSIFASIGADSLFNVYFGSRSGQSLTTGNQCTFMGYRAGWNVTTGFRNTLFGESAGAAISTGFRNAAFGARSLLAVTTGSENTAVGTAFVSVTTGSGNIGIGYLAGGGTTTGSYNIAFGGGSVVENTLSKNKSGSRNLALGHGALSGTNTDSTVFNGCIAIGYYAMRLLNGGDKNIGIGDSAFNNTRGFGNVVIGANSLTPATAIADSNVIISPYATSTSGLGSNNIVVGPNFHTTSTLTNAIVLGAGMTNNVDNIVRLGRADQNVIIGSTASIADNGARLQVEGDATVADEAYDATAWNASLEAPTKNAIRDKFESLVTGNGIYGGSGSLPGNVTVTGANNSITFDDIFAFHVNSDYNVFAKANGTGIYSSAIVGAGNIYEIGYTPVAGVFSKGAGVFIDTNENVGIGTQPPTTIPLYATGASLFVQGLQSNAGIFPRVDNVTVTGSLSLTQYFLVIDATAGNITLTLPAASTAFGNNMGIAYKFQRIDATGNTVTIQRASSDTINGGTSFTLTTQWEEKEIQCVSTSTWLQH